MVLWRIIQRVCITYSSKSPPENRFEKAAFLSIPAQKRRILIIMIDVILNEFESDTCTRRYCLIEQWQYFMNPS